MTNRWLAETGGTRGPEYAARFRALEEAGEAVHGEADLVIGLVPAGARVLDAGCGTGRVALELARRGYAVTGVDLDASMLQEARAAGPGPTWRLGDLAEVDLGGPHDLVLAAGNVLVYLAPGQEGLVVARLAAALRPGGLLLAGFRLDGGEPALPAYDAACAAAGLVPVDRWATWDREPYAGGDYAVSLHARPDP